MLTILAGAILVGLVMGLLGSGGSAILVPILVYLIGHDAKVSITESMAIVSAISIVGAVPFARSNQVDWNSVILFGIPAMLGTILGAWLGGLASDAEQLVVFGAVLLLAAVLMFRRAFSRKFQVVETGDCAIRKKLNFQHGAAIVLEGMSVGALTGFVGVGGGFLIVPALHILGKLPMRKAIGTSLVIIAMKSVVGFLKYQQYLGANGMFIDWPTVAVFVGIGLAGCFAGQRINSRLDQQTLKKAFAIFLIVLGGFIIFRESGDLVQSQSQSRETPVSMAECDSH